MKTKNKAELKAIAADVFKLHKKAQKVSVTADGMAFITDDGENAVNNHARRNRYGKELSITPFTRDEIENETNSGGTKTADELIKEIEAAESK